MRSTSRRWTDKIISALFIVHLLCFALGIVPEHLAALSPHDTCGICALIHHPPDLQPVDLASIRLYLREGALPNIALQPEIQDPDFAKDSSRAPPLHS